MQDNLLIKISKTVSRAYHLHDKIRVINSKCFIVLFYFIVVSEQSELRA